MKDCQKFSGQNSDHCYDPLHCIRMLLWIVNTALLQVNNKIHNYL